MGKEFAKKFLPPATYYRLATGLNSKRISKIDASSLQKSITQRKTLEWFQLLQKYLQVNRIDGVYMEFGCHEANTFRFALNTIGRYDSPNKISHFYAFDSFQGMPTPLGIDQQKIWKAGMNTTGKTKFKSLVSSDLHRVTIVPGFFSESLPQFKWDPASRPAVFYIDVDYYTSTKEVLQFVKDKLFHGSVIALDDWNCYFADADRGQRKAFKEFSEEVSENFSFEPFLPISWGGMSFIVHDRSKLGTQFG